MAWTLKRVEDGATWQSEARPEWRQEENGWVAGPMIFGDPSGEAFEVIAPRKRVVDRQEFLMLIPAYKEAAIRAFPKAQWDGGGADPFAAARPVVAVILDRVDTAVNINLDAEANIAAAYFLMNLGLLVQSDVDTILAGPAL